MTGEHCGALVDCLEAGGFARVDSVLTPAECEVLAAEASNAAGASAGSRHLLSHPWCVALARRLRAHPALSDCIGAEGVAVQCTYFEKSADRNWLVSVHQDLSIPVAARVDDPALTGWSEKDGELFVQAPAAVLAGLVAVRVHLDPCRAEDGALRVLPGSHRLGRIDAVEAAALRARSAEVVCEVDAGGVLLLRPLLVHASSKSAGAGRRRVLHFLYGPRSLPHGMAWREAV